MFLHRTARGKFFPWCAASRQLRSGRRGCQPGWLTLPVVQEQLLASVPDPGNIRYTPDKLDTSWHRSACQLQQQPDNSSSSSVWAMPLPRCTYEPGQLPIPALPVDAVPGLTEFLAAAERVFVDAAPALRVPLLDRLKVLLDKL
jgi:hypothetical protein